MGVRGSTLYKPVAKRPSKEDANGVGTSTGEIEVDLSLSSANSEDKPPSILTEELKKELGGYDFPFANIAFEGGGNKGLSVTGSLRVLEELGYWENINRFAGASAGGMVAALVAIGYTSYDIEEFLTGDIQKVFLDAKFGIFSLLPNMLRKFGWHPGKRIYKWFGDKVKAKTGNADLTFAQLYRIYKKELCITVTNLNNMDCTYCHVKTTPDWPIRRAVQMSASIPGVFCPVKVASEALSTVDYFVDGGLLCNFPIHCFDGWYLSMKQVDSFFEQLYPIEDLSRLWDPKERFGGKNKETIGVLMYAGDEKEVMKADLMKRFKDRIHASEIPELPETKMASKGKEDRKQRKDKEDEYQNIAGAMSRFTKALKDSNVDHDESISLEEFENAMTQTEFRDEDKKLLFGDKLRDPKKLFNELDINGDKRISFRELVAFAEKRGLNIMDSFTGYKRQEINSLGGFFSTLMDSLLLNMKRIFIQSDDVQRTIGIDTDYIDTLDFEMERDDQQYLINRGKLGCIAFLREHIAEGRMVRKT